METFARYQWFGVYIKLLPNSLIKAGSAFYWSIGTICKCNCLLIVIRRRRFTLCTENIYHFPDEGQYVSPKKKHPT